MGAEATRCTHRPRYVVTAEPDLDGRLKDLVQAFSCSSASTHRTTKCCELGKGYSTQDFEKAGPSNGPAKED